MLLASADKNKSPGISSSNAFLAQRLRASSTALIRLTLSQCRLLFNAVKRPQKQPAHRKRKHKPNKETNNESRPFPQIPIGSAAWPCHTRPRGHHTLRRHRWPLQHHAYGRLHFIEGGRQPPDRTLHGAFLSQRICNAGAEASCPYCPHD